MAWACRAYACRVSRVTHARLGYRRVTHGRVGHLLAGYGRVTHAREGHVRVLQGV